MAQINKPNTQFNTVLWSGNSSTQAITGVNFQPDFNWIKVRTQADNHILTDSVRPSLAVLNSDRTNAEQGAKLSSLDSDGFTCTSDSTVNGTGQTYVAWNWLAGGTAVSNTDGSITSSVSANTTSGFSIVTYTGTAVSGATVGHGLGVAPSVVIVKNRTGYDWQSYWSGLGNTRSMVLNSPGTGNTGVGFWNNTNPSSSVVTLGNDGAHSGNCVMYCFAEKKGFSKFGSYTGNGTADGTFVYTGFKPAFVIIKRTDVNEEWIMTDSKRGYPQSWNYLLPSNNAAESASGLPYDFLSNGIKFRTTSQNESGSSYVYMAFAENPLVGTNNIPATAR
jgi:hypothetical protein